LRRERNERRPRGAWKDKAKLAAPDWSRADVQNETYEVAPEREDWSAAWDAPAASGELPSCSVESVAANKSIYRGVRGSWKKESSPAFF